MRKTFRRALVAGGVALGTATGAVLGAPAAHAQEIPLDFDVTATTYIAGLDQESTIEGGTFVGDVDLATGELTADLTLPPSETTLDLLGLPLATAGFETESTGPTTGSVDLANMTVQTSTEFHINILYLRPGGQEWLNLVGDRCQTRTPITIETEGPLDLEGDLMFEAEFEIPKFQNCGLVTPILNLLIPGPGNTFSATLTPAEA